MPCKGAWTFPGGYGGKLLKDFIWRHDLLPLQVDHYRGYQRLRDSDMTREREISLEALVWDEKF